MGISGTRSLPGEGVGMSGDGYAVADPGFSGGGASTPKSAIIFQFFCRKLHENERIWTPMGAHVPGAPLTSTNGMSGDGYVQSGVSIPGGSMSTWVSISGVGMSMGGVCPGVGTHPPQTWELRWVGSHLPPPRHGN